MRNHSKLCECLDEACRRVRKLKEANAAMRSARQLQEAEAPARQAPPPLTGALSGVQYKRRY